MSRVVERMDMFLGLCTEFFFVEISAPTMEVPDSV